MFHLIINNISYGEKKKHNYFFLCVYIYLLSQKGGKGGTKISNIDNKRTISSHMVVEMRWIWYEKCRGNFRRCKNSK